LYKEYGENKGDVIVLSIRPAFDFSSWQDNIIQKSELYSADEGFQYFYAGNMYDFSTRFMTKSDGSRFLVVDPERKIFRTPTVHQQIKGAINAAQRKPGPPKIPFFETFIGRIIPGAILGMVLSIIFYRIIVRRRIRKHELMHRMAALEQKAMKAQLNPHFLFNSLNSIQHLIHTNNKSEADRSLTMFARLVRRTLNNSEKESIPISEELETLKLYIELEQMRFDFTYLPEIDVNLDIFNTMMPPMLLQPVVENAIIHGLYPREKERMLKLKVRVEGAGIVFNIEDNGVGRKSEDPGDGMGLEIISSRIRLLRESEHKAYSIIIEDRKDESGHPTGTIVSITIPDEN